MRFLFIIRLVIMTIIRAELVVNYYFNMIFNAKVMEECTFLRSFNYKLF